MPILMKLSDDGRRTGPVLACDHCGGVIERAVDGNAEWTSADPTPRFTHKKCCRPFEAANGGRTTWHAIELSHFLLYLTHNAQFDRAKAEASACSLSLMT